MDQELITELHDIFIEEMSKRIGQLAHNVSIKDIDGVQFIAHKIHGAGGTYGFHEVSDLGKTVETAAKTSDWDQVQLGLCGLQTWSQQINKTE